MFGMQTMKLFNDELELDDLETREARSIELTATICTTDIQQSSSLPFFAILLSKRDEESRWS